MRASSLFLLMAFFSTILNFSFANELRCENESPKILVLVIASDNQSYYVEEQKIWRSYMHRDPVHVEAYFIKGKSNLRERYKLSQDVIYCKTVEDYAPGILDKTVLSMEFFGDRINEFDYVIRTNLSSFYNFPRLLNFLRTAPKTDYYAGIIYTRDVPFISGDGIILSRDLAKMLVAHQGELLNKKVPDDLLIGRFFFKNQIKAVEQVPRMDLLNLRLWTHYKDNIPGNIFQFRVKNEDGALRITDEIFIQKELVKMFY